MKLPIVGQRDALERIAQGDTAGVIEDLQARLKTHADDDVAWLQLGLVYLHINHVRQAEEALKTAVDLDGSVLEARLSYAQALSLLRKHDAAAFQLVQAKRIAPQDVRVLHQLGIAFFDKGLYPKALRELERAQQIEPDNARVRFAIGLAHERNDNIAGAIAAFRGAIALDPSWVDPRRTLADALASIGELAAAVEELQQALRIDRTNTAMALNLEVLQRALEELRATRLLGNTVSEVERSTLVKQGQLKRKGIVRDGRERIRYGNDLAELWLETDLNQIVRLTLVLCAPQVASQRPDDCFEVKVVAGDGREVTADYATAISLTFLREALGCPLMRASQLYRTLLDSQADTSTGDAQIGFEQVQLQGKTLHGIWVGLQKPTTAS